MARAGAVNEGQRRTALVEIEPQLRRSKNGMQLGADSGGLHAASDVGQGAQLKLIGVPRRGGVREQLFHLTQARGGGVEQSRGVDREVNLRLIANRGLQQAARASSRQVPAPMRLRGNASDGSNSAQTLSQRRRSEGAVEPGGGRTGGPHDSQARAGHEIGVFAQLGAVQRQRDKVPAGVARGLDSAEQLAAESLYAALGTGPGGVRQQRELLSQRDAVELG